jgi:hypothetical protein
LIKKQSRWCEYSARDRVLIVGLQPNRTFGPVDFGRVWAEIDPAARAKAGEDVAALGLGFGESGVFDGRDFAGDGDDAVRCLRQPNGALRGGLPPLFFTIIGCFGQLIVKMALQSHSKLSSAIFQGEWREAFEMAVIRKTVRTTARSLPNGNPEVMVGPSES